MNFEIIFPYLKGFHLTLSQHLPGRNEEGWRLKDDSWNSYVKDRLQEGLISDLEAINMLNKDCDVKPPQRIKPVPLLVGCLDSLATFFSTDSSSLVTGRSISLYLVLYGFVDASKQGFGAILESDNHIKYQVGAWAKDAEDNSSNWREFSNLVDTLSEESELGALKDSIIIIATDNSTVEGVFHKGNSTSPLLYKLIVKLRQIELHHGLKIYVTHVSGERMKKQGANGLSWGHFKEGVCIGDLMVKYCPWGQFSHGHSPLLKSWLREWLPQHLYLEPIDWFDKGHDLASGNYDKNGLWRWNIQHGTFVRDLPPGAVDAGVEELRKARLKRQRSTHIVLIPKLFTHM